jgi:hypothetical protein
MFVPLDDDDDDAVSVSGSCGFVNTFTMVAAPRRGLFFGTKAGSGAEVHNLGELHGHFDKLRLIRRQPVFGCGTLAQRLFALFTKQGSSVFVLSLLLSVDCFRCVLKSRVAEASELADQRHLQLLL